MGDIEPKAFLAVGKGRICIVKGAPSFAELLRGQPFVGGDAKLLEQEVLKPLGLTRADVVLAWCDPIHDGEKAMQTFVEKCNFDVLVSMSEATGFAKDKRSWNLPTTEELRKEQGKFSIELARKLNAIRKRLDATAHRAAHSVHLVSKGAKPTGEGTITAPVFKANAQKQIIYAVVLDPYQVDTQDDWCPPKDIEDTAHAFVKSSRVMDLQHEVVVDDAFVVESFVEIYPSESDKVKAFNNEPHRAYARQFGKDVIHSGAWILGVQLSDRLWAMYEKGDIGAFSIGGLGRRSEASVEDMPEVTFVEIGEVGRATVGRTDTSVDQR